MVEIHGEVADGFEPVREVFEENFETRGDVGAGFALYLEGEKVIDLIGGVADQDSGEPYTPDTLQLVFSTTKGATAICANLLAQRGELDLDAPVAEYWPEFGHGGKEEVPVRWLLTHRSGLIDVDHAMTFEEALEWDLVTDALARATPRWEPGSAHGYHAVTYGWLVGEVIRRVSGRSVGTFLREEVTDKLAAEFYIGLPRHHHERVAPIYPFEPPAGMFGDLGDGAELTGAADLASLLSMVLGPDNLIGPALTAPGGAFAEMDVWNHPDLLAAEIPAASGVTNAPSLARIYAATVTEVDGVRLFDDQTVKLVSTPEVEGPDAVIMFSIPFSHGFMTHSMFSPFGQDGCFGHYGAGGSVGFADPDKKLGFGYVMNQMQLGMTGDARAGSLVAALYESIAAGA